MTFSVIFHTPGHNTKARSGSVATYDCECHVHHFADEKALENHFKPFIEVIIVEKDATNQVLRAVLKF